MSGYVACAGLDLARCRPFLWPGSVVSRVNCQISALCAISIAWKGRWIGPCDGLQPHSHQVRSGTAWDGPCHVRHGRRGLLARLDLQHLKGMEESSGPFLGMNDG